MGPTFECSKTENLTRSCLPPQTEKHYQGARERALDCLRKSKDHKAVKDEPKDAGGREKKRAKTEAKSEGKIKA
jgi:hypothetical protein